MKKILAFFMTLLMFCTVPTIVQAANTRITVSDTTAEQSEIVYLTINLSDCAKADTLYISYEYDSSVLKKIASNCSWANKGAIEDFDVAKDNGVWTANKAKDLNGEICTLAFRVKADAPSGDTDVICKLTVKKGAKEIGTYTAEGTVSIKGDDSEDPNQEQGNEQEGTVDIKPSTSDKQDDSLDTNSSEDSNKGESSKPMDSGKEETNTNSENTSTDFSEQQDTAEEVEEEVTGQQHTDACDYSETEVEEEQGNRVWDIIWIVCALLAGMGIVALIIKKVDRKKK